MRFDLLSLKSVRDRVRAAEHLAAHGGHGAHRGFGGVQAHVGPGGDGEDAALPAHFRRARHDLGRARSLEACADRVARLLGQLRTRCSTIPRAVAATCACTPAILRSITICPPISPIPGPQPSDPRIDRREPQPQRCPCRVGERRRYRNLRRRGDDSERPHVAAYRTDRLVAIMPAGHPLAGAETVRFAEMAEYDIVGPQQGSSL